MHPAQTPAAMGKHLGAAAKNGLELAAIMHHEYARDPAKLHARQTASRVERAPQREKKPADTPTPPL